MDSKILGEKEDYVRRWEIHSNALLLLRKNSFKSINNFKKVSLMNGKNHHTVQNKTEEIWKRRIKFKCSALLIFFLNWKNVEEYVVRGNDYNHNLTWDHVVCIYVI